MAKRTVSVGEREDELTVEQEKQFARRGGCIAVVLVLVCGSLGWWGCVNFTEPGREVGAAVNVYWTYHGLPLLDNAYINGFPDLARASCRLDNMNPPPADIAQQRDMLAEQYQAKAQTYKQSFYLARGLGVVPSSYEDPSTIPTDINQGKRVFCSQ